MNTNIQIHKYKTKAIFLKRFSHVLREKNLSTSEHKNEEFLNKNEFDNRDKIQNIQEKNLENNSETRTVLSKKMARLRYKIKNSDKENLIKKWESKIKILEEQRENTEKLSNETKQKNHFLEITFSITKGNHFVRNEDFSADLSELTNQFLKETLPNFKLIARSQHLDQSSPHIHNCGQYGPGQSFSKDLVTKLEPN